ncbi:ATP-binding protein [Fimbriiglobus ruber]|uniref:histidine kinase n=1 Tax=Fimbriiglobus ruber TaxID=1908690 RepID=A0A225DGB6_9BACT|nr:ATP-binding protein [Fimbriiglobus ruber]OWK38694.1 Phytochrome, two-component sensor histidine kinase [Fimbriiglobus ruber]
MNEATGYSIKSGEVTLTNCDREPIHIPGCVLPHGALLALRRADAQIVQASANTGSLLGVEARELLGRSLDALLDPSQVDFLTNFLRTERLERSPLFALTAAPAGGSGSFDVSAQTQGEIAILEWEPSTRATGPASPDYYTLVKKTVARLQTTLSLRDYCRSVTEEMRGLTGLDRVMVYRFLADGSGWIFAESKRDDLNPYLDLHYPPSDIPKPARDLFLKLWHRLVPDVRAEPAELVPLVNPVTNAPLDMGHCALRGASVMYTEYLRNMGVAAALVLPLIRDGRLWGLIATHHYTPKYIPHHVRVACEFLAQVVSLQLAAAEDREQHEYKLRIRSTHEALVTKAASTGTPLSSLVTGEPGLLELIDAGGVALLQNGEVWVAGRTPAADQIRALAGWVREQNTESTGGLHTHALPSLFPAAEAYKDTACGLLAVPISRSHRDFLMWFRPEQIETVSWAGYPYEKTVEIGPHGPRLTPRKSFELWQESVHGTAPAWAEIEVEAARRFRVAVLDLVIGHAEQLARVNKELEATIEELDAFAYVASHDLKEPLRGIHSYAAFLIEDYEGKLGEDGETKLRAMMRLSLRMESLIESLLHYSRTGRGEMLVRPKDLNVLLRDVRDTLQARIRETGAEIRIPRPLPAVHCDPVLVGEVYANLVGNALKYNDKAEKWVEIGYDERDEEDETGHPTRRTIFYVRDNGIGIQQRHHDSVFRIFKRLHARDKFGGGTGAGLTIVKKIVERHGGRIWIESTEGEGTTFYFTLGESPPT